MDGSITFKMLARTLQLNWKHDKAITQTQILGHLRRQLAKVSLRKLVPCRKLQGLGADYSRWEEITGSLPNACMALNWILVSGFLKDSDRYFPLVQKGPRRHPRNTGIEACESHMESPCVVAWAGLG